MDFFNIKNEELFKEEKEQNITIWTRKPKKNYKYLYEWLEY